MNVDLNRFKREIDLRAYAESLGYEWDKADSWKGEYVMRKEGDKIAISYNQRTGHWMYSSLRGDLADCGTIIDFAMRRRAYGYPEMVAEFNAWLKVDRLTPSTAEKLELAPVEKDFGKARRTWGYLLPLPPNPYLEQERRIPAEVLLSERFRGAIKGTRNGNAAFPHYGVDGQICGIEFKGPGVTRFISGGRKTLWTSNRLFSDDALIICEGGVECLSYAALFDEEGKFRYVATAGYISAELPELRAVMREMPVDSDIVGAMNPDEAGMLYTRTLKRVFEEIGREDLNWRVHYPENEDDWNDEWKRRQTTNGSSIQNEIRATND